jgi:hypothetical protein
MRKSATGTVAPAGTQAAAGKLTAGQHEVLIESVVGENDGLLDSDGNPAVSLRQMVRCVYPDGSAKNHQVANIADLLPQLVNQLRGRFGVVEVQIASAPAELKAGASVKVEV